MASGLHALSAKKGLVKFVKPSVPSRSVNLQYKSSRRRRRKRYVPSKSFQQAFHKLQPSKEIRYDVTDVSLSASTNFMDFKVLDNIAQGTQLNQRLGSNVHVSYLHLFGTIQSNSTAKAKVMRFIVLREVNNGDVNTTTWAGLYKKTGTVTYTPSGDQEDATWPVNRQLATPLWEKRYRLQPEAQNLITFREKIRINKIAHYTPNDAADSTPYHGRLIFIVNLADCDNSPQATTVVFSCSARVFFKDHHKAR